jgi:hypothetical protein
MDWNVNPQACCTSGLWRSARPLCSIGVVSLSGRAAKEDRRGHVGGDEALDVTSPSSHILIRRRRKVGSKEVWIRSLNFTPV